MPGNLNVAIHRVTLKSIEDRVLLKDICFSPEANSIYTILGKNGSGKSTLLKAIPNLLDPRFYSVTGTVFFKETNIYLADEKELAGLRKNKIRYVLQDAVNSFDHLKKFKYYFQNILPGKTPDMSGINELLEYFLLPDAEKLFGLFPYEVSGGMAQRISFVLCLLANPEVILLDEPTSGIDSAISNLFLLKLKDYVSEGNNCAILVTHDLKMAQRAGDKVALLAEGNLSEFVSPDVFFSRKVEL